MLEKHNDEYYMREALKEAVKAYNRGEVPIGCVIVKDNKIISRAYNLKEKNNDCTAHAEILAIRKASKKLGWRLTDCDIYITVEPCPMCIGAIIQCRINRVAFGTFDPKAGAVGSVLDLTEYELNHKVEVASGILKDECEKIIKIFFKELRKKTHRQEGES